MKGHPHQALRNFLSNLGFDSNFAATRLDFDDLVVLDTQPLGINGRDIGSLFSRISFRPRQRPV